MIWALLATMGGFSAAQAGELHIEKYGIQLAHVSIDGAPMGRLRNSSGMHKRASNGVHEVWVSFDDDGALTRCHGLVTVSDRPTTIEVRDRGCSGLREGIGERTAFNGAFVEFRGETTNGYVVMDGRQRWSLGALGAASLNVTPGAHTFVVSSDVHGQIIVGQGVMQLSYGQVAPVVCTPAGCSGLSQVSQYVELRPGSSAPPRVQQASPSPQPARRPAGQQTQGAAAVAPAGNVTCPARRMTIPADLEAAMTSVVAIRHSRGVSAGVVVDPAGSILTAAYPLAFGELVTVTLDGGIDIPGTVNAWDGTADLARIAVRASSLPCLQLATSDPSLGSDLFAIGAPPSAGLTKTVSPGVVGGYPEHQDMRLLQTNAPLVAGQTGGPLLNARGQIAGIISSTPRGLGRSVSLAVPASSATDWFAGRLDTPAFAPGPVSP